MSRPNVVSPHMHALSSYIARAVRKAPPRAVIERAKAAASASVCARTDGLMQRERSAEIIAQSCHAVAPRTQRQASWLRVPAC